MNLICFYSEEDTMVENKNKEQGVETKLIQLGRTHDQYGFVCPPIYRGSTVLFNTLDELEALDRPFSYGTKGTPTVRNLEMAWSELSNAAGAVLLPSGLAAIAFVLLSLTEAGDHILVVDTVYHPTRKFCDGMLKKKGVEVT